MLGVGRPLVAVQVRLTVLPALGSALHVITALFGKSKTSKMSIYTFIKFTSLRGDCVCVDVFLQHTLVQ